MIAPKKIKRNKRLVINRANTNKIILYLYAENTALEKANFLKKIFFKWVKLDIKKRIQINSAIIVALTDHANNLTQKFNK